MKKQNSKMTVNTDLKEGAASDYEIQQKESMATIASIRSTELEYRHPIHIQQIYKFESDASKFRDSHRVIERNKDPHNSTFHETNRNRHSIHKVSARPEMNATRITLT